MPDTFANPHTAPTPEVLDVFGAKATVLSNGSGFGMVAVEQIIPPGHGVLPHIHDIDDELFYIVEGELTVTTAAATTKARAGDCASLPHGGMHTFRNDGDAPARVLIVITPGTRALAMFREFDSESRKRQLTPPDIMAIAGRHGVRFV